MFGKFSHLPRKLIVTHGMIRDPYVKRQVFNPDRKFSIKELKKIPLSDIKELFSDKEFADTVYNAIIYKLSKKRKGLSKLKETKLGDLFKYLETIGDDGNIIHDDVFNTITPMLFHIIKRYGDGDLSPLQKVIFHAEVGNTADRVKQNMTVYNDYTNVLYTLSNMGYDNYNDLIKDFYSIMDLLGCREALEESIKNKSLHVNTMQSYVTSNDNTLLALSPIFKQLINNGFKPSNSLEKMVFDIFERTNELMQSNRGIVMALDYNGILPLHRGLMFIEHGKINEPITIKIDGNRLQSFSLDKYKAMEFAQIYSNEHLITREELSKNHNVILDTSEISNNIDIYDEDISLRGSKDKNKRMVNLGYTLTGIVKTPNQVFFIAHGKIARSWFKSFGVNELSYTLLESEKEVIAFV